MSTMSTAYISVSVQEVDAVSTFLKQNVQFPLKSIVDKILDLSSREIISKLESIVQSCEKIESQLNQMKYPTLMRTSTITDDEMDLFLDQIEENDDSSQNNLDSQGRGQFGSNTHSNINGNVNGNIDPFIPDAHRMQMTTHPLNTAYADKSHKNESEMPKISYLKLQTKAKAKASPREENKNDESPLSGYHALPHLPDKFKTITPGQGQETDSRNAIATSRGNVQSQPKQMARLAAMKRFSAISKPASPTATPPHVQIQPQVKHQVQSKTQFERNKSKNNKNNSKNKNNTNNNVSEVKNAAIESSEDYLNFNKNHGLNINLNGNINGNGDNFLSKRRWYFHDIINGKNIWMPYSDRENDEINRHFRQFCSNPNDKSASEFDLILDKNRKCKIVFDKSYINDKTPYAQQKSLYEIPRDIILSVPDINNEIKGIGTGGRKLNQIKNNRNDKLVMIDYNGNQNGSNDLTIINSASRRDNGGNDMKPKQKQNDEKQEKQQQQQQESSHDMYSSDASSDNSQIKSKSNSKSSQPGSSHSVISQFSPFSQLGAVGIVQHAVGQLAQSRPIGVVGQDGQGHIVHVVQVGQAKEVSNPNEIVCGDIIICKANPNNMDFIRMRHKNVLGEIEMTYDNDEKSASMSVKGGVEGFKLPDPQPELINYDLNVLMKFLPQDVKYAIHPWVEYCMKNNKPLWLKWIIMSVLMLQRV